MSQFLKQSTAALIMFGPFVDKGDGVTLETGAGIITSIDHATTGIFLSKNGAAAAIRHQSVTASVLDAYGMFKVTLDATDTGTVGTLDVLMAEAATFLPVHKTFMVLPANVYDALMGTDLLDINAAQWLGTACAAPTVAGVPEVDITYIGGVAQSLADLKDLVDTGYDPSSHKVQGLVLADLCTANSDMVGTDGAALASAWTATLATALGNYTAARAGYLDELAAANIPADIDSLLTRLSALRAGYLDNLSAGAAALEATLTTLKQTAAGTFDRETESLEAIRNRGDAAWITGGGGTAADIADAVWDELMSGHIAAGSFGLMIATIEGYVDELESGDKPLNKAKFDLGG